MYTPPEPSLSGPSFHPLYVSKRSKGLPEAPTWAAGDDVPAWTDVLIDCRLPHSRNPLPDDIGAPEREWESVAPGWSMSGWSLTPVHNHFARVVMVHQDGTEETDDVARDVVSLVRLTDPDGFSFSLVVSHDKPNGEQRPKFNGGRFAFLLPTMRLLFTTATGHEDGARLSLDGFARASMAYSLPTLRDAVRDPAAWFGTTGTDVEWSTLEVGGAFRPITPVRALLAWAAGGASSYAEAVEWVRGGMDPAEVAGWRDQIDPPEPTEQEANRTKGDPWTDDEIRAWFTKFGGGDRRRKPAIRLREGGLTVEQAFRWQHIVEMTSGPLRPWIDRFEATGWEPEHIHEMKNVLRNHLRQTNPDNWWGMSVGIPEVGEWAFMSPDRALAYFAAGFSPEEVMRLEEAGEPVDLHTLTVMAGLLAPSADPNPYW